MTLSTQEQLNLFDSVEIVDADEAPAKKGKNSVADYVREIQFLERIPAGKQAKLKLPKEESKAFSARIRAAAFRLGRTSQVEHDGKDTVYVGWTEGVKERKPRTKKESVNVVANVQPSHAMKEPSDDERKEFQANDVQSSEVQTEASKEDVQGNAAQEAEHEAVSAKKGTK